MVTIERKVGRLVEIRPRGATEAHPGFGRVIALANELGRDAKVLLCIDARQADPVSAAEQARIRTAQLAGRERIERIVTVVGDDPLHAMQTARLNEGHRDDFALTARTPAEAVELLADLLNPAELARLKQFLAEV
jgi:hypothetical protein